MNVRNDNTKKYLITPDGLAELKKEYSQLTETERPKLMEEIAELRSMGDLSENAAYHQARRRQSFLEGRIQELEEILAKAVVQNKTATAAVQLGSKVTVAFTGEEKIFHLVGESEADFTRDKISTASPLGKTLLTRRAGEEFTVNAPGGDIRYRILKVE